MPFENYSPKDRHISGQVHIASWIILAALVGILTVMAPIANSNSADDQIAATIQDDCTV